MSDLTDNDSSEATATRRLPTGAPAVPRQRQGLVIVNTGNGKGKTTAALGVLFRAWGRGMKVAMVQFIKSSGNYGELRALRKAGIEVITLGGGFTWLSRDINRDIDLACRAWEEARARLLSGSYDVVVLDEMTYAVTYGWLSVDEVIAVLKERPGHVHVIITGRNAPTELIEYADLVTEMREVKHPYQKGIRAQPGIDF